MLKELEENRRLVQQGLADDLGFLGATTLVGARGPWVVQYWRSPEHLYAYANDQSKEHVPAWRAFNKAVRRNPGAVGIWHETYAVPAAGIETLYDNGAVVGLAAATGLAGRARRRLARTQGEAAPALMRAAG